MLVLLRSVQDFTSMAFKCIFSGIFGHLESYHIESKSFQTFHTSPNHWVLMKKTKFGLVMIN